MSVTIEEIRLLVPDFEVAVSKRDDSEAQRKFALGSNCIAASERGRDFFVALGLSSVRREVHYKKAGGGHHFLAFPGDSALFGPDDLVVDPTYLQFRSTAADIKDRPNTFVGSRKQALELMTDTDFVRDPKLVEFYEEITWVPLKT